MHSISGRILFVALCSLSMVSNLLADVSPSAQKASVDYDHAEYVNVLNRLDKTIPNSIIVAKEELLARFGNSADDTRNEAFRSFWKFYGEVIRESDRVFSSKEAYQKVLFEIAEATGLYYDPYPAFEKLDTEAVRKIKSSHTQILGELSVYRKAGMNFGSSEGTWYLKDDLDFLLAVSSIATGGYKDYLRFYTEEWRKVIADDGGLMISWESLRKRIVRWEQFADQHPQLPETEKDIRSNISWMLDVYLTGIDNSRILRSGGILDDEVKRSYEAFLKEGASSAYYGLMKEVYSIWEKNQFRVSMELVNYLKEKGHGRFLSLLKHDLNSLADGNISNSAIPVPAKEDHSSMSGLIIFIGVLLLVALIAQYRRSRRKSS